MELDVEIMILLELILGVYCRNEEFYLIRDLMLNYDRDVRPSVNQSTPVIVTMDMTVHQILQLDEKHELLTTSVWQRMSWNDINLKWDPRKYGGLKKIRLSAERIWSPDITLVNNVRDNIKSVEMQAVVKHDGSVSWNTPRLMKSSCPLNIVYFPWDKQICNLQFASWTHDGSELALFSTDDSADDTDYVENGEWKLLEIPVIREQFFAPCCEAPFSYLNFHITLLRRSGYYLQNLIFPSLLITTSGMLVFVLPPESGEKVSLSVTILLATSIYQLIVADHIPVQSKVVPVIGLHLMTTQLLLALSMVLTILVLNIHHQGDCGKGLPPCLRLLLRRYLGRILFMGDSLKILEREMIGKTSSLYDSEFDKKCLTRNDRHLVTTRYYTIRKYGATTRSHHVTISGVAKDQSAEREIGQLMQHLKKMVGSLSTIEEWIKGKRREEICKAEWILLAKALDRLFLIIFTTSFIVSTLAILTGHAMFRFD